MRFDDSLATVLAGDAGRGAGADATWRQLVDLIARRRVPADGAAIERLETLRGRVSVTARAASARALAGTTPPAALVALLAADELPVAASMLRAVTLPDAAWLALLPRLGPSTRAVLRQRRDLSLEVERALAAFGVADFVLHDESEGLALAAEMADAEPIAPAIPLVPEPPVETSGGSQIADLIARIDAFTHARRRGEEPTTAERVCPTPDRFEFETDAAGTIRWVAGVARAALVGASIAFPGQQGAAQVDAVASGAFRRRSSFASARLEVSGLSSAAGSWRLSGVPLFDQATGRLSGYRGSGRRPRVEESAAPRHAASESLRQLVHELRTPANAIAGFAELIETELAGPVLPAYRERAATIRRGAAELIGAIDDLDTAARIEGGALDLRASALAVEPIVVRALADLAPLIRLRGAEVVFAPAGEHRVAADDRAVERLIARLLATAVSAAAPGERLRVRIKAKASGTVLLHVGRPRALVVGEGGALLSLEGEADERDGAPLLGTGFALRLARNLAAELGGSLTVDADRLTLRLPAAVAEDMGQATR